jgi:hypothetical protein
METAEERRKAREREEHERARYQRKLDEWWQGQRDLEEEERRIRREIDPFGWGHWN